MKYTILILFIFYCSNFLSAQGDIILDNPSFEGIAQHSTLPYAWKNASILGESPPDIHSNSSSYFDVITSAQEGNTYMGLVVRDTYTWEAISQKLNTKLRQNVTYEFTVYLARSRDYISLSRTTSKEENFNEPVILRIWGGNITGDHGQLLAISSPVEHTEWLAYTFQLTPEKDWEYLMLEAYFTDESSYNGNLLIDNCSTIKAFPTITLAEVEDFSELAERDLFQLILECKAKDNNHTDMQVMDIIYDSWHFEQTCVAQGMKELVSILDDELLQHYIVVYETLGLENTITTLKKTAEIQHSDSKKLKEKRFLKRSDEVFFYQLKDEMLLEKQLAYIDLHRTEIAKALAACKEKE